MKSGLTERELAVLRLKSQGKTRREIGEELDISTNTVRAHLWRIALKLQRGKRDQSDRELAIMKLVSKGYTNDEIAKNLRIAKATVKAHLNNLSIKLSAHNRIQLMNLLREKLPFGSKRRM